VLSEGIKGYDDLVSSSLLPLIERSLEIGDRIEQVGDLIGTIANATRSFLVVTASNKKPSDADLAALGAPVKTLISELEEIADSASQSGNLAQHIILAQKAAPAFKWFLEDKPVGEIQKAKKEFELLSAKIKGGEFKDRVEHMGYVDAFAAYLAGLEQIVSKHFPDGVAWNPTGGDAPKMLQYNKRGGYQGISDMGPAPSLTLDKDRWYCSRQVGVNDLSIDSSKGQTVYILYCRNGSVSVKGAPARVVADGCAHMRINVDEVTGSFDIVNGIDLKVKCKGSVPTINVTKTNGAKIYLEAASADADLVISTSTNLKVVATDGDSTTEYQVPSKFKVKAKGGKLTTIPVV
jgi:hypothetical protein